MNSECFLELPSTAKSFFLEQYGDTEEAFDFSLLFVWFLTNMLLKITDITVQNCCDVKFYKRKNST